MFQNTRPIRRECPTGLERRGDRAEIRLASGKEDFPQAEPPEMTSICGRWVPRDVSRMPRYAVISCLPPKSTPASFSSKAT
jgi:hypothetical protein